jgi:hypothetical protein
MKLSLFFSAALLTCLASRSALAQDDEAAPPPLPSPEPAPAPAVITPATPNEAPPPSPEDKNRQKRDGFTMEIGIGASFMTKSDEIKRVEDNKFGLAPISIGLGAWLSRDTALTFRMTGTSLFQDRAGKTEQVVLGFYGAGLQYYVNEKVYVGGGVGLGLLAGLPVGGGLVDRSADRFIPRAGVAAQVRTGFAFYSDKKNQLSITGEIVPLWLGDAGARPDAVGFAVGLGWQLM